MKIVVVNDVHVGRALVHNGMVRAASHLIGDKLERILDSIIGWHSPDLVINLGDLIRSESKENDLITYTAQLGHFKNMKFPVIHLIGNHELKKMDYSEVEKVWHQNGFQQKSYGTKILGHYRIIWLGLQLQSGHSSLPEDQITWLKETLSKSEQPTLIFSHVALDDHDTTGNFFYEAMDNKSKALLFLQNQQEIKALIENSPSVKAVFQSHLHYFHINLSNGIPFITCPAFADNICGPHTEDNIPEIYTTISLNKNSFVVKAYSGEYCFAGYEM